MITEAGRVFCIQINVDIPGELAVFVADHGWAVGKINPRDLLDWDLCAGRGCNQHATQLLDIIAEIAFIAHVHGISFTAFNVFTDIRSSDSRRDRLLDVSDGKAVFRALCAVYFNIHVKALGHPSAKKERPLRRGRRNLLELVPDWLTLIKDWALVFLTNR